MCAANTRRDARSVGRSETEGTVDSQRFDLLARQLAAPRTRRGIVKTLAGALLGAGAVARGARAGSAQATCAGMGAYCTATEDCCEGFVCGEGGTCIAAAECAAEGESCAADEQCCAGICCAGFCRNIACCIDEADPNARCPEGTACFEGVCDPIGAETGGVTPTPAVGGQTGGGTALPTTGSGTGADGGTPAWILGAAGAAGAAALLGGAARRREGAANSGR